MSDSHGDAAHVPPARSGAYPRRAGNAVVPLVDGEAAFRRICEAVEGAERSVWITVAYLEQDVPMPDGRGSFFDVLDAAVARGLDVRVLFWREPRLPEIEPESTHFGGGEADRALLRQRRARFAARWDRHPTEHCHHQKSWLVDAGGPGERAFVGGINLLRSSSTAATGHAANGHEQDHDLYVEVRGPAASDVHHNFVQRWNGASERERPDGVWPEDAPLGDLDYPRVASAPAGEVPVQITRTVMAGLYAGAPPAPDADAFPIADGECSVYEQYVEAIGAARDGVYLEDQAIAAPAIVDALADALARGVAVFFLVPGNAHPAFVEARRNPRAKFFFDALAALGRHEAFTLAAIAGRRADGTPDEIYVHAKIMLVDDAWGTIGSTNVADRSFRHDTELNASFWHGPTSRTLRVALLAEHTGEDTSGDSFREALARAQRLCRANEQRRGRGEAQAGLAYALDPATYGA